MPVNLVIRRLDPGGGVIAEEQTIADNIGRAGARVMTGLSSVAVGELIEIEELGGDFKTRARVRGTWAGPDGIPRLNVEFTDQPAPERLSGSNAPWTPPQSKLDVETPASGARAAPRPTAPAAPPAAGPQAPAQPPPTRPQASPPRTPRFGTPPMAATATTPPRPASSASATGPAAPAGKTPGPEPPAGKGLEQKVIQTYEGMRDRSHYELLGIAPGASEQEVKSAYSRLARQFHPDRIAQTGLVGLKKPANSIFIRLGQALDTLSNQDERSWYDRKLGVATPRPSTATAPTAPNPPAAPAPERPPPPQARAEPQPRSEPGKTAPGNQLDGDDAAAVLGEARALFKSQKYYDVILRLEEALPRTGHERVRHAMQILLARATLKNPKWMKRAEELLVEVTREDEKNLEALGLLGVIYRESGLRARAARMYKQILQLDPGHQVARAALAELERRG